MPIPPRSDGADVGGIRPHHRRDAGACDHLAQAGKLDAITFAPLNKAAMFAGGWRFPDEHKMFAHLLKHQGYFSEMNVLDGQWMSRVTSHVSLREALDLIDARAITDAVELVDRMMKSAGIAKPRIAVAALNPHAGENGLFGRDEIELIRPTVERIAATGIACSGPYPVRYRLYPRLCRRVRQRRRDVSRPGPDRDEAEGLQPRRHRDGRARPSSRRRRTARPSTSSARAWPRRARSEYARSNSRGAWRHPGL
jgi:hypothetical protein